METSRALTLLPWAGQPALCESWGCPARQGSLNKAPPSHLPCPAPLGSPTAAVEERQVLGVVGPAGCRAAEGGWRMWVMSKHIPRGAALRHRNVTECSSPQEAAVIHTLTS